LERLGHDANGLELEVFPLVGDLSSAAKPGRRSDLDALRAGRKGGRDDQRRGQHRSIFLEVDFGQPNRVKTEILGRVICASDSSNAAASVTPGGCGTP